VVRVPPLMQSTTPAPVIAQSAIARINIEQTVIYEDQNLLVINKPTGLAVHGGSGVNFGVIELLRTVRPDQNLELIHRIDRDTSGCLMLAKNSATLRAMHAMLRDKKITKTYHTVVKGFANDQFVVQQPLKKYVLSSGERLVKADPDGSAAETKFSVLQRFKNVTLLQAQPITGRTHQIRVHAAVRGLPIIGDQKYGDKVFNQIMCKLGLQRLFLHAYALNFICPITGVNIKLQADYDQAWIDALTILT
ncbi:MAG TPA: RluA family pseudouridine synthase, partial [Gammaproteobacteria bacterium]|nr:RluA family pseudouridine synthase [Gammaproteobacteria bacterium]